MLVFFRQGLYASFALNTYYLVTSCIGIWQWSKDKRKLSELDGVNDDNVVHLNKLTLKVILMSAFVLLVGTSALAQLMSVFENPMSYLDSFIAVLSALATWWLVKAYIEQWWLWIVADTLSVLLCFMQGMWWMAALYLAYVAAAVYGLRYWKKCGVYLGEIQ
jgi:nicotinamide mononucleotide transporter